MQRLRGNRLSVDTWRCFRIACLTVVCCALLRPAGAGETLRVGFAESDITPPDGFPMSGYYHERLADGTIDPLKAKAIVFCGESAQAALVVCDLTGISIDLASQVRSLASEQTGIPPENIVVSATHSHTAPDYWADLYQVLAGTPRDRGRADYIGRLIQNTADAIVAAHAAAAPAMLAAGSAQQEVPVAFNRRFLMRDGSARTWMNFAIPGVVRPAGPIDPEIGIVLVRSPDGTPRGALTSFALHLDTVGGTKWSADYPFFIEQSLRRTLGPDVVSVFGVGTSGDINHADPSRSDRNNTDFIGQALAASIESQLPHLKPLERADLRVRSQVVRLPLQSLAGADLQKARQAVEAASRGESPDFYDLVTAYKLLILDRLRHNPPLADSDDVITWGLSHAWAGIGDALPVEVQAICVGDELAIVCLPGEVFVELGLAIKRGSPFRTTLVIELCNSVETIYIPTRAACAQGSYEVTNATTQPGSGEMLVEAALSLLRSAATEANATLSQ